MTVEVIVNNYTLGARVRSTPTHKLTEQRRIDSKYTKLTYGGITENELQLIEKALGKRVTIIDEN